MSGSDRASVRLLSVHIAPCVLHGGKRVTWSSLHREEVSQDPVEQEEIYVKKKKKMMMMN